MHEFQIPQLVISVSTQPSPHLGLIPNNINTDIYTYTTQKWCCPPATPALKRLTQEDAELNTSLGDTARPCLKRNRRRGRRADASRHHAANATGICSRPAPTMDVTSSHSGGEQDLHLISSILLNILFLHMYVCVWYVYMCDCM